MVKKSIIYTIQTGGFRVYNAEVHSNYPIQHFFLLSFFDIFRLKRDLPVVT